MLQNLDPKIRQYILDRAQWFFGFVTFALISILWIDRFLYSRTTESLKSLGDFLKLEQRLDLIPNDPANPFFGLVPVKTPDPTSCPNATVIQPATALLYLTSLEPTNTSALNDDMSRLLRLLSSDFETVPSALSRVFTNLNRFIQTRKGFDHVEESLRLLIPRLQTSPDSTLDSFVPPSLFRDLDLMHQSVARVGCHWHQAFPLRSPWAFQNADAQTQENASNLFPARLESPIQLLKIEAYIQETEFGTAFPLWIQKTAPNEWIEKSFTVLRTPVLPRPTILAPLEDVRRKLEELNEAIQSSTNKVQKTVSWQLRNLVNLLDRAARYTPPDANSIFMETIAPLNDHLSQFQQNGVPRWDDLAAALLEHDQKSLSELNKITQHPLFQISKSIGSSASQAQFIKELHSPFQTYGYWVFAKQPLDPLARLETIIRQKQKDPSIEVSMETPWLYWWFKGRPLLYSQHFFFWRQLLLGVAIGMTLILWTFKKVYFSSPQPPTNSR